MAVRLPLYPFHLGNNVCYLYICEDAEKTGVDTWNYGELIRKFGSDNVKQLVTLGILIKQRHEYVRLSFKVMGQTPYEVKKILEKEICHFTEVLTKLPRQTKVSSNRLKNWLVFLENFSLIQLFPEPMSGVTCIVSDCGKFEDDISEIYSTTNYMEPAFIYQSDVEDGVFELTKLISKQ